MIGLGTIINSVGIVLGGITGLLLAAAHPELLSALVVSGASLRPDSTKDLPLRFFRLWSHVDRSDKMQIMMREPQITDDMLHRITVPVHVTVAAVAPLFTMTPSVARVCT